MCKFQYMECTAPLNNIYGFLSAFMSDAEELMECFTLLTVGSVKGSKLGKQMTVRE